MKIHDRITASLLFLLVGCGSTATRRDATCAGTLQGLASRLVEAAELRTDLSSVRVHLGGIRTSTRDEELARTSLSYMHQLEALEMELEHELVMSLSPRMHVLDDELTREEHDGLLDPILVGVRLGATHTLVGDFARRDQEQAPAASRREQPQDERPRASDQPTQADAGGRATDVPFQFLEERSS